MRELNLQRRDVQLEVSEGVAEYIQLFSMTRIHTVAEKPVPCHSLIIKLWRTPHATPDAATGTLFKQDVVAMHQQ